MQWTYHKIGLSLTMNLTWSIVFTVVLLFFLYLIYTLKIDESNAEKIAEDYKDIMFFMPQTDYQFRWTIFLSISAGITEEVIFRGFVFAFFDEMTGWIVAILIANLIFALNHIWSGLKNLASSFILGLIFSTIYILTESLILPIILHIFVDLYSMRTVKLLNDYLAINHKLTPYTIGPKGL